MFGLACLRSVLEDTIVTRRMTVKLRVCRVVKCAHLGYDHG